MRKRWIARMILTAVLILTLCGCAEEPPAPLVEGTQPFVLGDYSIPDQGLAGLVERLRQSIELPKTLTVRFWQCELTPSGRLGDFSLVLGGYDGNRDSLGGFGFYYDESAQQLDYAPPETYSDGMPPPAYNANHTLESIDRELKRLPLVQQIAKLKFPRYVLRYQPGTKLAASTPILDGSAGQAYPVLSLEAFKNGEGGLSDGHTAMIFTLYDGTSLAGENLLQYRCAPADPDTLYGDRDFTMQCDYSIDNGRLRFTRDWGETWLQAQITEPELEETLAFYRTRLTLPDGSWFVSPVEGGPVAFFLGNAPALRLTVDQGAHWRTAYFPFAEDILLATRRFVGFCNSNDGYAGLGSDWSMGAGEYKTLFLTRDGGQSWQERALPLNGTSQTLTGVAFTDGEQGVVSLDPPSSEDLFPQLWATQDGGESWFELTIPWGQLEDLDYLTKVDTLERKDGMYQLVLGQGDYGAEKVRFTSSGLESTWILLEQWTAVQHSDG